MTTLVRPETRVEKTSKQCPASVAIACSGLGNVKRGNETWAFTVAEELHRHGVPVTLFGGGPIESACPYQRVANLPREMPMMQALLAWERRYFWEQASFGWCLERQLPRHRCDLVQIADPTLALRVHRKTAKHGARVIYKDGLLLGPAWCSKFDQVQVLAPQYREAAAAQGVNTDRWFVIPHMIDTNYFTPAQDRAVTRRLIFGSALPSEAFVVLAVGDMAPESSKRLNWIVQEVARLPAECRAHLVIAGAASDSQREGLTTHARRLLGERVHVLANLPRADMRSLYQSADAFAHAALREPFGIVFLEAMACGLPIAAHPFAVTQWIVAPGGAAVHMESPGALAALLREWQANPGLRKELGQRARQRAINTFAPDRVVPLYVQMYDTLRGA